MLPFGVCMNGINGACGLHFGLGFLRSDILSPGLVHFPRQSERIKPVRVASASDQANHIFLRLSEHRCPALSMLHILKQGLSHARDIVHLLPSNNRECNVM